MTETDPDNDDPCLTSTALRIIEAAEALFGARSYRDVTVAEICHRSEIATGSFYNYFDSKGSLFAALVRNINRDVRKAMHLAIRDATNQREVEVRSFEAFFDLMSDRPHVYRIVREAEFVAPDLFREYYEHLARGFARGVRWAQQRQEVDPDFDPEVIAYIYMGVGYFVGMRWAEWTGGAHIPADIKKEVQAVLARALPPRD